MNNKTATIHPREPRQPGGRTPYAFWRLHELDPCDPFVAITIGDERGCEVVVFARDVRSLTRIAEAVLAARFALENSRPLRVNMDGPARLDDDRETA